MKKMISVLVVFTLTTTSVCAGVADVFGRGDKFIKVTEYSTKNTNNRAYVGFELCLKSQPLRCEQIGSRLYYSKSELTRLRNSEKADVAYAALADVGLVLVAIYGGAIAGAAVVGGEAAMVGASGGVVLGTGSSAALITYVDAVNPAEQYRQVKIISNDIINDVDVTMKRDIEDIAHTLNTVLSNLD